MRLLAIALASGALVLAPGIGLTQSAASELPDFEEADQDGDGAVTIEEAKQAGVSEERAKSQDFDDDGELTKIDWGFLEPRSEGSSPGGAGAPGQNDPGGGAGY